MKFKIFKNKCTRNNIKVFEKQRKILLFLKLNETLPLSVRWTASILLTKMQTSTNKITVKNICILTGQSKSISRKYKLSRISLKYFIFFNKINGLVKTTW